MTKLASPKTVLVTGASGFIGRSLGPTLQAAGLRAIGVSGTGQPQPGYYRTYCARFGDSLADVFNAEKVAALVHCAHASGPGEYQQNLNGTRRWLEAARQAGVGLHVFLSTLSAQEDALAEYGRVKYTLEGDILQLGGAVFRLGLVVGDGGMYARIRQPLRQSRVVPLLDNGRGLLYVLGIRTLSMILRDTLLNNGEGLRGQILSPHQPQPFTLKEVLVTMRRVHDYKANFVPVPSLPVLWALRAVEALRILKLPVTSTNVRGLRQGYPPGLRSDFARFGYPSESLETLVREAGA
jgi:nucleoside-diphosphate-sugar epimerase